MNVFDPRLNNFSQTMWYINSQSPLNLKNYKVLMKKNPNIQNLNKIAKKIKSVPTKRNIKRVLKQKQIQNPKKITIKVKQVKIHAVNNQLVNELRRLQSMI